MDIDPFFSRFVGALSVDVVPHPVFLADVHALLVYLHLVAYLECAPVFAVLVAGGLLSLYIDQCAVDIVFLADDILPPPSVSI